MSAEPTGGLPALDLSRVKWRKSSFSTDQGGNCVEVASVSGHILVRDSKDPDGATLTFTPAEWAAFIAGTRDGQFDLT